MNGNHIIKIMHALWQIWKIKRSFIRINALLSESTYAHADT